MEMTHHDLALAAAGAIGMSVATIHGVLTQRLMVRPVGKLLLAEGRTTPAVRQLIPLLLHYSTVTWFLGGIALVAAALAFEPNARSATAAIVGAMYLYGAVGNMWATRARHPGWMLMAAATLLIIFSVSGSRA